MIKQVLAALPDIIRYGPIVLTMIIQIMELIGKFLDDFEEHTPVRDVSPIVDADADSI